LKTKSTDDLRREMEQVADLNYFLEENESQFHMESIVEVLEQIVAERGIQKSTLAKNSGMSVVYLHQIFSRRRNPSRNRVISLCFGLGLSLEETQVLLRRGRFAELYLHNRRDAILIYGLMNGMSFFEVNDRLFEKNEETLC